MIYSSNPQFLTSLKQCADVKIAKSSIPKMPHLPFPQQLQSTNVWSLLTTQQLFTSLSSDHPIRLFVHLLPILLLPLIHLCLFCLSLHDPIPTESFLFLVSEHRALLSQLVG